MKFSQIGAVAMIVLSTVGAVHLGTEITTGVKSYLKGSPTSSADFVLDVQANDEFFNGVHVCEALLASSAQDWEQSGEKNAKNMVAIYCTSARSMQWVIDHSGGTVPDTILNPDSDVFSNQPDDSTLDMDMEPSGENAPDLENPENVSPANPPHVNRKTLEDYLFPRCEKNPCIDL